jgi:hypothetical protein
VVIATRTQAKALDLDKYMTKEKWCCCHIATRKIPARRRLAPTATAANGLPNLLQHLRTYTLHRVLRSHNLGKPQARTLAAKAQQDEQIEQQKKFVRDEARAKKKEVGLCPAILPLATPTPCAWPGPYAECCFFGCIETPKPYPNSSLHLYPVRALNGSRIVATEGS